jgi:hypothetical protein
MRTFHLQVICLRYIEEIVAIAHFEGVRVAFFVYEGYFASIPFISISLVALMEPSTYSSPGLGGSIWPWCAAAVAEKCRIDRLPFHCDAVLLLWLHWTVSFVRVRDIHCLSHPKKCE